MLVASLLLLRILLLLLLLQQRQLLLTAAAAFDLRLRLSCVQVYTYVHSVRACIHLYQFITIRSNQP